MSEIAHVYMFKKWPIKIVQNRIFIGSYFLSSANDFEFTHTHTHTHTFVETYFSFQWLRLSLCNGLSIYMVTEIGQLSKILCLENQKQWMTTKTTFMFIATLVYMKLSSGTSLLSVLLLYISLDNIIICPTVPAVLKYTLYYVTPTRIFRLA